MNRLFYIALSFYFFNLCFNLNAQAIDSLEIINSKYDSLLKTEAYGMDRLFYKHKNDILINNLGPFGSKFYSPTTEFLYKKIAYPEEDGAILSEFRKLKGVKPFTNLTYINASRKEQIFGIKHMQNFGKQLFFAFELNKISSPGAFLNQEANNSFFNPILGYQSKKKNYEIVFTNKIERNFYEENGGLFNSSNFENKLFDDEQNYSVNLRSSNSFIKRYGYKLFQRVDLGSIGKDSLLNYKFFISHAISYETNKRVFFDNDPTSNIYINNFLDSIKILQLLSIDSVVTSIDSTNYNYLSSVANQSSIDSTFNKNLSNIISVGFRNHPFKLELLYQYDIKDYYQGFKLDTIYRYIDTNYINTYVGVRTKQSFKNHEVLGIFKYGITGYRKGDILSEVRISKDNKRYNLYLKGGYFLSEADLKMVNYVSNHFNWNNNNFSKQSILEGQGKIYLKKFRLELEAVSKYIINAFYYDSLSIVTQNNEGVSFSTIGLAKDYSLWNFYFRTALKYQITSNQFIVPIPQLIVRQVMYYENRIFKKALKIQLGFGLSYSSDYYGYSYSPALTEFYVQHNQLIGNYPKVDIFLNTYLKRAQIFLKWEHINSGINNNKSYLVPNYPILSRSLKFGISWNMFD